MLPAAEKFHDPDFVMYTLPLAGVVNLIDAEPSFLLTVSSSALYPLPEPPTVQPVTETQSRLVPFQD